MRYDMESNIFGGMINSGQELVRLPFEFPKYFRYENPNLRACVDGNEITVYADNYAKSIEILNDNEDFILSDNYFDLNAGSKTVKVIQGNIDHIRLRSVYDI